MTSREKKKTGVRVGFCFRLTRILWASHGRPLLLCLKCYTGPMAKKSSPQPGILYVTKMLTCLRSLRKHFTPPFQLRLDLPKYS